MQILVYLCAIFYALSFWSVPTHDPDLGWHLLGGAWISLHHAVPRQDFINSFNLEWIDYHWLAQYLIYQLFKISGYDGLQVALGLLMATIAKLIVDIILRCGGQKHPVISTLLSIAVLRLIGEVASLRPQVISVLFLLLALKILIDRSARYQFSKLLGLTIALVNIHVYWIFLPALWFLYKVVPELQGRTVQIRSGSSQSFYTLGGFLLISLAGFVSPYALFNFSGYNQSSIWSNYFVVLDYLTMPTFLQQSINEFKGSLAIDGPAPHLVILILILCAVGLKKRRIWVLLPQYLGLFLGAILALRGVKFIALFAIFSLPILARSTFGLFRKKSKLHLFDTYGSRAATILTLLLILNLAHASLKFPLFEVNQKLNADYMQTFLPLEACSKIPSLGLKPKKDREHLRVLTFFDLGGWCRWQSYQADPNFDMRVTSDGRTQFVPVEHYQRSFDLYKVNYQWAQTLKSWAPDVVLAEKGRALAEVLNLASQGSAPSWKIIYQDQKFALFTPQ